MSVSTPSLRSPSETTNCTGSRAKRNAATLFQLFVQQREDALRGGRGLGAAFLVQDVHHARFFFRLHLHAVLLGLHLAFARTEEAREEAALGVLLLHVALGIG